MTRVLLGAAGVLAMGYGGLLLVTRQDPSALVEVGVWLAVGVLVHDAVLAPLVVLLVVGARRWLPAAAQGPAVVGLLVLGSVTLLAVPVLGRFGAVPENPTLLDRPYVAGWAVIAGLTALGVVVGTVVVRSRRRSRGTPHTTGRATTRRPS